MPFKNLEEQRAYKRKWYAKNSEKVKGEVHERKRKLSLWLKEYKSTLKCAECGESHPACIEFHHKDSDEKEHNIGTMIRDGYSIESIKQEIDKCIPLCANCHRKLHYNKQA